MIKESLKIYPNRGSAGGFRRRETVTVVTLTAYSVVFTGITTAISSTVSPASIAFIGFIVITSSVFSAAMTAY